MTIELQKGNNDQGPSTETGIRPRVVRLVKAAAVATLMVFGSPGCGEHDELPDMTKQAVKFDDVPENVRTAATKAIPGVKLNEAWKNLERGGKFHSYEIRGKNAADGKTREVRVSTTGEILEME
jgi:hypothetical protein